MNSWIDKHLTKVQSKQAESSYKTRRTNLRNFNQWLEETGKELTELSTLDLDDYFTTQVNQGYAPNTVSSRYESVRALFDRLTGRFEVLEENPFKDLDRREFVKKDTKKHSHSEISYVTPEEKEALCDHVPTPSIRNELIIRLMWQTGIRKTELVNIELEHLDRDARSIRVWSNKSKEWRKVFYQPSLDILLDQWLDRGHRDCFMPAANSSYLFVTERSEKLNGATVTDDVVKPAAEAAGMQEVLYQDKSGAKRYRITPHSLRHRHAVNALKSGIDVLTVQKHLGHSSLEITMNYLQLIDEDVKEAYQENFASG